MARNQVTKNAVKGDPINVNLGRGEGEEMECVSTPIATETPNTTRKYIDGVKKIKNIVNAKAAPAEPMNSMAKSDMDEEISLTDSINTLFEGSEITDEFKEKLTVIFESAVKEKVFELMTNLEEHYNSALEEEISTLSDVMIEAIDSKLNYIAGVWLEENEIALEQGVKLELFENFIGGMKVLFQESYVDIPDERYDVLTSMSESIENLESQLNEQIDINVELNTQLQSSLMESTINDIGSDLSINQKDKLKFLSEDISFGTEAQLRTKLKILKESLVGSTATTKTYTILEEDVSGDVVGTISENMDKYVNAL
jgi:hypothetical protein